MAKATKLDRGLALQAQSFDIFRQAQDASRASNALLNEHKVENDELIAAAQAENAEIVAAMEKNTRFQANIAALVNGVD
jgi:hypothetical protein